MWIRDRSWDGWCWQTNHLRWWQVKSPDSFRHQSHRWRSLELIRLDEVKAKVGDISWFEGIGLFGSIYLTKKLTWCPVESGSPYLSKRQIADTPGEITGAKWIRDLFDLGDVESFTLRRVDWFDLLCGRRGCGDDEESELEDDKDQERLEGQHRWQLWCLCGDGVEERLKSLGWGWNWMKMRGKRLSRWNRRVCRTILYFYLAFRSYGPLFLFSRRFV